MNKLVTMKLRHIFED